MFICGIFPAKASGLYVETGTAGEANDRNIGFHGSFLSHQIISSTTRR
jgi:hypothetical protein